MHMQEFICKSLSDTRAAAEKIAQTAVPGKCFALYGNLGYGKTTFAQFFIKSLNPEIVEVISPTFNIVCNYSSDRGEIWHVDCYRLKSAEEIHEMGLEEAFANCICIIEWPEIIEEYLPNDAVKIKFEKSNGMVKISIETL